MTRAADDHRELDRRFGAALGEDPGYGLVPARNRGKDARTLVQKKPRVLLLEVEIRTSAKGGTYYTSWCGRARLVGFEEREVNERGHRVIRFYAEEPQPRPAVGNSVGKQPQIGLEPA